jgi:hemolysin activation/secretion protein
VRIDLPRAVVFACALALAISATGVFAQAGPRFEIRRFEVVGNTAVPAARIDAAVKPFLGPDRDFAAVQAALAALQKLYADAGLTTVEVALPEQRLKDGVVRIEVRELKFGKLEVEGNRYYSAGNVRRSLPALVPGQTPDVNAVARNLRAANENPSKQTKVFFRAGEAPGTVDAAARVSDQRPLRAALSVDSTGTPSTGILRAGVSVQHANLFDRDHVFSANYLTSPEQIKDVSILGLGYRMPIYSRADSAEFAYLYSDVDSGVVGGAAGNLAISGRGNFYLARYNWYLPRRGDLDHRFVFGADWRQFQNNVRFGGTSIVPDITTHPVSAGYSARVRTAQQDLSGFLSAFRNIPGGNDGTQRTFDLTQAGAPADYTLWRGGFNWLRTLPREFQLRVSATGQWSGDKLIPGEQFGLGGMDSVRGFLEREIANDRGYRWGVEGYTPDLGTRMGLPVRTQALVFFDYGEVRRVDPLPSEIARETISSTGVGLRAYYQTYLSVRLDYGYVLQPGGLQSRGDQRLQGMVTLFF